MSTNIILRDSARMIVGVIQEMNLGFNQMISRMENHLKEMKISDKSNIIEMNAMLQEIKSEINKTKQVGPHTEPTTFTLNLYTKIQQYIELATRQIGHELECLEFDTSKNVVPILNKAIHQVYIPYFQVFLKSMACFPEHVAKSFLKDCDGRLATVFGTTKGKELLEKVIERHASLLDDFERLFLKWKIIISLKQKN